MSMVGKLMKVAGKDDFNMDEKIRAGYMIRLCWKYGWMMVRGRIMALGYNSIANDCFIGKHVKLIEKSHLTISSKTKIHDDVKIDALSSDGVKIGDHVVIGHGTVIECTGDLSNIGRGLHIGNRTTFNNNCFFGAAGGIEIGEDVMAGQFVRFHAENHNYDNIKVIIKNQGVTHKGIRIGNNCWIGSGAVFLDGSELGEGCVVAANAVVTKKFRQNSVIAGIPARVVKMRGVDNEKNSIC